MECQPLRLKIKKNRKIEKLKSNLWGRDGDRSHTIECA